MRGWAVPSGSSSADIGLLLLCKAVGTFPCPYPARIACPLTAGTEVSTPDLSYRCSHGIAAFAAGVLSDLREDPAPPRTVRSGPPVELFRFTDHGACVAYLSDTLQALLAQELLASIAILTLSREFSTLYYRGLHTSEVPRLRQVTEGDFTFAPGIEATEIAEL